MGINSVRVAVFGLNRRPAVCQTARPDPPAGPFTGCRV
jgi:hypothetical protein